MIRTGKTVHATETARFNTPGEKSGIGAFAACRTAAKPSPAWHGELTLLQAIRYGCIEEVRRHLDAGADPNARDEDGRPLLLIACYSTPEIVHLLLERGAGISAPVSPGIPYVCQAAMNAKAGVITVLLEAGADPKATDGNGKGAIAYAVSSRNLNVPKGDARICIVKTLLAKGCDINAVCRCCRRTPHDTAKSVDHHEAAGAIRELGGKAASDLR
jgi:hypothetical protein